MLNVSFEPHRLQKQLCCHGGLCSGTPHHPAEAGKCCRGSTLLSIGAMKPEQVFTMISHPSKIRKVVHLLDALKPTGKQLSDSCDVPTQAGADAAMANHTY